MTKIKLNQNKSTLIFKYIAELYIELSTDILMFLCNRKCNEMSLLEF